MTNTTTQSNWTDKEYREVCMFDCTLEYLEMIIAAKSTSTLIGNLVSTLSDVQEMMATGETETIRRTINRVKYVLNSLDHQER